MNFSATKRSSGKAIHQAKISVLSLLRLKYWKSWIVPVAILIGWAQLSTTNVFPAYILPHPARVFEDMLYLWSSGDLPEHIIITLFRVVSGFLLGTAAATLLGALTGYSRLFYELLDPTLQAIKSIPSLGWVPLFILWFGIFETSKIILIAVGVFFPVYLNLMTAIRDADRKLFEVAEVYRLSTSDRIFRVLLPGTLPAYFTGLRSGLALGWMFVIAAELMGASRGLGFLMLDGQMTGNPSTIIGALILFAFLGKGSDVLLTLTSSKLLSWQDTFSNHQ